MRGWYGDGGWGSGGWSAGSWIGMGLGMLVFWGLVIVAVIALVRWVSLGRRGDEVAMAQPAMTAQQVMTGGPVSATALTTLDERFARGDLTEEDYRHSRDVLLGR